MFLKRFSGTVFRHCFALGKSRINSLAHGRCDSNFKSMIFKLIIHLGHSLWSCSQANFTGLHWWKANIGASNSLLSSANRPSSDSMLTKFYVATWHGVEWHYAFASAFNVLYIFTGYDERTTQGDIVPGIRHGQFLACRHSWQGIDKTNYAISIWTFWGWYKIAAIFQTTSSNAFYCMKINVD